MYQNIGYQIILQQTKTLFRIEIELNIMNKYFNHMDINYQNKIALP
jgi:hypothetical protein